jgi:hypothetical protein
VAREGTIHVRRKQLTTGDLAATPLPGRAARADAVLSGLALGLAGRRALYALDALRYGVSREYRSEAHNLRGLMPWEEDALDSHFGACRRLVVLGAGGGREVLALTRRGHEAEGFECNPRLVSAANRLLARQRVGTRVHHLPRDAAPTVEMRYDGAVVGWSAYTLIMGRAARTEVLRGLRRLLPVGAPLLASFFTRDEHDPRSGTVYRVASAVRRLTRRPPVEPGDDFVPEYIHRFTRAEVEAEFAEGGFELQRFVREGTGEYDSGFAVGRALA